MKRIVFVDLDDTLFQTKRKNPSADRVAAVDRMNQPRSFQSRKQETLLHWLAKDDALLIPVTGRNVPALLRVKLVFSGPAICSFGAVILESDGHPNPDWQKQVVTQAGLILPLLNTLLHDVKKLATELALDVRFSIVEEDGVPLYLSIKNNHHVAHNQYGATTQLAQAVGPLLPEQWILHLNGSNMALMPPFLRKDIAVSHLIKNLSSIEETLFIGVGDSLTDHGFMALCDLAITPGQSQIMRALGQCSKQIQFYM